ncbi:MAG: hypothetical protein COA66_03690 [Arcobacter sp.]|nr:MAG: hypothetical protein COA66_03690 [Arcobacter sp.]
MNPLKNKVALISVKDKKLRIKYWKEVNKKAIEKYNEKIEKYGLILQDSRMF